MKAKELMICDLVMFEDNIHKITDLSLCIDGSVLVHVDGYECNIFEHEISPIPLTEEILKANGFTHKETMDEWWHEEYDPTWGMQMSDFELTDEFMFGRAKITYVHELQHALRLCGLNEFADNFKIQ